MRRSLFVALLLGVCCASVCAEQSGYYAFDSLPEHLPQAEAIELSLEDCVLLALEANYGIVRRKIATRVADAGVLDERGAFEPVLFGEAGRTSVGDTNTTTETESAEVGLRTRLVTGTDISLSTSYSEAEDATNGTGRVRAEISQPLLRDFGIKTTRAPLLIARGKGAISRFDLRQQMIDTASFAQDLYWSLVSARERLSVQEETLRFAGELAELTMRRAEAGLMGESDTVEARAAVYAREADVARAAQTVREIEDSLKESLALMENPALWTAPVVPTTAPSTLQHNVDFLASLRSALECRPDYQAELARLRNSDLSLYMAKNGLLPKLDLVARGERLDEADGPGDAFDAGSNGDEEIWSVFIKVELPLGNKEARAAHWRARAEREQQILSLKGTELTIIREVRRAVDNLNTTRQVMESTAKAVEFEQKKLDNERVKLDLGRSATDNVVRFIESLNNGRLRHVQAVINYNQALVRLDQVQGTTLITYGVNIENQR